MASTSQYNNELKPKRIEVFRPAAEEQYDVGKDVFFGQEGVAGKILSPLHTSKPPARYRLRGRAKPATSRGGIAVGAMTCSLIEKGLVCFAGSRARF